MERDVSIAVIGGGPAGLAGASAACEEGIPAQEILILERADELGGILNQCIHNGFGLHTFREELTGPEYAARFIRIVQEKGIPSFLHTMVIDISRTGDGRLLVTAMNAQEGLVYVHADAVVLAMGCRERPRGALNIPGSRPAGIYTAGTAQRFVNLEGRMPGREIVILGSGDIGLIMARRMTLEGARVKVVAEVMPYSGGLKRNIVQCLNDYDIPLKLSHTVIEIRGRERLESVVIAEVGPDRKPIPGTEEEYTCDTLLLSCGLIPENELTNGLGASMSPVTNGPLVNESLETDVPGVFACGNVLHVHDLVDYVSEEAAQAGANAAAYVRGRRALARIGTDPMQRAVPIRAADGVRYTVPSCIRVARMADRQKVRFRVGAEYRSASIQIELDGRVLRSIRRQILAPGEMEEILLKRSELESVPDLQEITLRIVPQGAA